MEHPGQRLAARSPQVARSTSAMQSRPLSADDIQKAKMRAQFMQNKHGKTITPPDEKRKPESDKRKSESENKLTVINGSHSSLATSVSKSNVQIEPEEQRKVDDSLFTLSSPPEISSLNLEEPPPKKYKRIPIPWQMPPGTFSFAHVPTGLIVLIFVAVYNLSDCKVIAPPPLITT